MLLLAFVVQGTWALAGTTGTLTGTVVDEKNAPVAAVTVTAQAPSGNSTTTTDGTGHFVFLSLAPDTYTVSVDKTNYSPASQSGISVFADQTQTVAFHITTLKQIGSVISKSANSYVKSGTTNDVYSVNAATQEAIQGLGGGGNLNSAYSAVYGTPGVTSYVGNYGFGQVFYIRGGAYDQTGYEYDGVPVNRAFDNYNANSLSTLGQQELQVYAGGSPNGASSNTQVGFINQVIRTGTYPGYGTLGFGLGAPGFYHEGKAEAGGATPTRNFSYYVGTEGVNQQYNLWNNQNAGNIAADGSSSYGFTGNPVNSVVSYNAAQFNNGPYSACTTPGVSPAGAATFGPNANSCTTYFPIGALYNDQNNDREFVANFHIAIPHHRDSGRDDVQMLLYNFGYRAKVASSFNKEFGSLANLDAALLPGVASVFGPAPYCGSGSFAGECSAYPGICGTLGINALFGINPGEDCSTTVGAPGANPAGNPIPFMDGYIFPAGTAFGSSAAGLSANPYYFPNSTQSRSFRSGIDPNYSDGIWNNGSIAKLQYQKNIGSNAYVRLLGYTFYSDWLQNAGTTGSNAYGLAILPATFFADPDYELNTHTRGAELQYANQINPQNLVTFTANYTTASSLRWNNTSGSPNWLTGGGSRVTNFTAGTPGVCYSYTTGNPGSCYTSGTSGTYATPTRAFAGGDPCATTLAPGTPACVAGATFLVTVPQNHGSYLNSVTPKFTSVALEDQIRPNDRLNVNLGIRWENYEYDLRNVVNPEFNFWYAAANNSYCVDPGTGLAMFSPVTPTTPPGSLTPINGFVNPGTLLLGGGAVTAADAASQCYQSAGGGMVKPRLTPSGAIAVHPGFGGTPVLSNVNPPSYTHGRFSPRLSGTYSFNPDTVFRFSAGRFTQPTPAAFEQYTFGSGQLAPTQSFQKFYNLGFNTPGHDNPIQVSDNIDFSFERHFKGTDMSMKFTPFYRYSQNQSVLVPLGPNFVSAVNVGTQKTTGLELAFQKGDPGRDGLSAQLALTYVNALIKYNRVRDGSPSVIDVLNNYIRAYNGLTSFCGTAGVAQAATGPNDATHLCPAGNGTSGFVAAPCYAPTPGTTGPGGAAGAPAPCGGGNINNPYFMLPVQALLDPNGYYPTYPNNPPGDTGTGVTTALGPLQISGFLSWKRNKLTVTPNFVLSEGNKYGSPTSIIGIDPRNCGGNEGSTAVSLAPIGAAFAGNCDYQTAGFSPYSPNGNLAIPNPYTGRFDTMGQYRNPWQLNIGAQFKYEVSPRVSATLLLANIYNRCFGGQSTAWQQAFTPNNYVCGYNDNTGSFIGTVPGSGFFYNGSGGDSANGTAGYPKAFNYPYAPLSGALPFQAYFLVNFKL